MAQDTYPPVADVYKVEFLAEQAGGSGTVEVESGLYVRDSASARTNATMVALGQDARDAWIANVAPVVVTAMTLVGVRVSDLDTVPHSIVDVPASQAGALSGSAMTVACAVVRLLGQAGGTPRKSYIRHGGLAESQCSGNTIEATGDIDTAWDGVVADITAAVATRELVIVSVYQPSPTPPDIYRDAGVVNLVDTLSTRALVGRAVSRQK